MAKEFNKGDKVKVLEDPYDEGFVERVGRDGMVVVQLPIPGKDSTEAMEFDPDDLEKV